MTVALSFSMFEQYGCGAKVTVKNLNTGAEAEAICTDSCPECDGLSRMDLR